METGQSSIIVDIEESRGNSEYNFTRGVDTFFSFVERYICHTEQLHLLVICS